MGRVGRRGTWSGAATERRAEARDVRARSASEVAAAVQDAARRSRRRRPRARHGAGPDGGRRPPAVVVGGGAGAAPRAAARARAAPHAAAGGGGHRRGGRRVRRPAGRPPPPARARAAPGAAAPPRRRPRGRRPACSRCSCASSARRGERVEALASRLAPSPRCSRRRARRSSPACPRPRVESGIDYAEGLLDLVGPTARAFAASVGPRGRRGRGVGGRRRGARRVPRPPARRAGADGRRTSAPPGDAVLADILRWEHVLDEPPEALAAYGREVLDETRAAMEEHRRGGRLRRRRGRRRRRPGGHARRRPGSSTTTGAPSRRRAPTSWSTTSPGCPPARSSRSSPRRRSCAACCPFAAYDAPGPFAERQLGFYYVTPPPDDLERGRGARHPARTLGRLAAHDRACTRPTPVTTCSS